MRSLISLQLPPVKFGQRRVSGKTVGKDGRPLQVLCKIQPHEPDGLANDV